MNTAAPSAEIATDTREGPIALEIWLIRHGETPWSRTGQHTGRTDIALTEEGREQARRLAPLLAQQRFDKVLASPLSRAMETCRLTGLGAQMETEPDAVEWNYGVYESRTTQQIRAEARAARPADEAGGAVRDWSIWHDPVPGGESLAQIEARALALMQRLLASHGRIALFSHGHFLRIFAGCWIGGKAALGAHLLIDTASVGILGFDRENRAIRQWNLRPPAK